MLKDLPPEIFSRILEFGVFQWGIRYLPPVCLTCKDWNDTVVSNPRLWGIIVIPERSHSLQRELLEVQITKAKAAPLTLTIHPAVQPHRKPQTNILSKLVSLARNWVYADVSANFLGLAHLKRGDLSNLEAIRLCHRGHNEPSADSFFDDEHFHSPNLRSFASYSTPPKWISGFLSLHITTLELTNQSWALSTTLRLLSQVPNLVSLQLVNISHPLGLSDAHTVSLVHLTHLELYNVRDAARLLCDIGVPALHTFSIKNCRTLREEMFDSLPLRVLFAQWSLPDFLPSGLHTLEIQESLRSGDTQFLIQWLERVKNLSRLILADYSVEGNIVKALTSSSPWLCPSLIQLFIEMADFDLEDLFAIARTRGSSSSCPTRLRVLQSLVCSNCNAEQIERLSYLVDELHCCCIGCQMEFKGPH